MKKIIVLIMSMLMLPVFLGCGIDRDKLVGEIVMSHSLSEVDGIVIYTPSKNEFKTVLKGHFNFEIAFNIDKTKILGNKFINIEEGDYTIVFEYNLKDGKIEKVIEYDKLKNIDGGECIKYVPNTDNVSYIANGKAQIYDRSTGIQTALVNTTLCGKYSWDKTGKKLFYNGENNKIYVYDLTTKENKLILEGRDPVLSNNNEYIAYMANDGMVTIYEFKTKKEWKCGKLRLCDITQYIFSPDDKYIAIVGVQYYDILNCPHFSMYVLDFKTGKKSRLLKGDEWPPAFDWK